MSSEVIDLSKVCVDAVGANIADLIEVSLTETVPGLRGYACVVFVAETKDGVNGYRTFANYGISDDLMDEKHLPAVVKEAMERLVRGE